MHPNTPTSRLDRAVDRLDAICRELNAPLAGALPALILAGVLLFGNPAVPHGTASEARPAGCDYSQAAGSWVGGPRSQDLVCAASSLERAAETSRERGR